MHYWEDMQSKWGFNDGDSVPPDAEARREVYLKAINTIATDLKSGYRLAPFDRPGVHNWCLIVPVANGETVTESLDYPDQSDEALSQAIDTAMEMDLDSCIDVTVTIDHTHLDQLLSALKEKA